MTPNAYAVGSETVWVWVIVREPSGVKSLFLRGRIEKEDISDGGWVLLVVAAVQ